MFNQNPKTKISQSPSGPPSLPPAPVTRQLSQIDPSTVTDLKMLEGRVIQIKAIGIAHTLQRPPRATPLAPHQISIMVERAQGGGRGGIEGKILLDPREGSPALRAALNRAKMTWMYPGESIFLPASELRGGYTSIDCQVTSAPDAKKWMASAQKRLERHGNGWSLDQMKILEVLPSSARIGIAGASLAGALIGFKFLTHKDERQAANTAARVRFFSSSDSTLSSATIDPKLRAAFVAQPTNGLVTKSTTDQHNSSDTTVEKQGSPLNATPPSSTSEPAKVPPPSSDTATTVAAVSRLSEAKPVKTFSYTPQNSVDISTIHLVQGQLTFRGDSTPVHINFNSTGPENAAVIGPLLQISEGDWIQALSIGLDSMRRANQGALPAGSTFRVVVSHSGADGIQVEREFPLNPANIPSQRELSYHSIMGAASSVRDSYEYAREVLCLNVSRYFSAGPGGSYLQSSFGLRSSYKTPARVIILRDMP